MVQPFKIFLASSAELIEDRREFEIQIQRRNNDWVPQGVHLKLEQWEDSLDVMSRQSLQAEYQRAARECDLFVMLFSTKVGEHTRQEFEATFRQFQAGGRPLILTYFKDAPITTGSVDLDDLISLRGFQKQLTALGNFQRVYKNTAELSLHFRQQLDKLVAAGSIPTAAAPEPSGQDGVQLRDVQVTQGNFVGRDHIVYNIFQSSGEAAAAQALITQYLQALAKDLANLKLSEIDASSNPLQHTPLQLAEIYVPLDTTLRIPRGQTLAQWLERKSASDGESVGPEPELRPVSVIEALAHHPHLTLLGKPGSGKSTFGARILLALAQAWMGHREELEALGSEWRCGPLLPIRVELRRFAAALPVSEAAARAGDLWEFIACDLKDRGYVTSANTLQLIEHTVRQHGALFLFDGLDECAEGTRRERVQAAVRELMAGLAATPCRFLLTARPYAWPSGTQPAAGVYALDDLNDTQIEQFIQGWYQTLEQRAWCPPAEARAKCEDLLRARGRAELRALASNPLLLTLMAKLHTHRGRLPDDRADLYNDAVELLLLRWNERVGADRALLEALDVPGLKLSHLREVLEELAFTVHQQNVGREGTADISEHDLLCAFRPLLSNDWNRAQRVVDYIETRAGLLLGQGEQQGRRQFTFPHRTFQEFLAARYLAERRELGTLCSQLARAAPDHWQVVLPLAARLAGSERGSSAADELVGRSEYRGAPASSEDWNCTVLAGMQLLELGTAALKAGTGIRAVTRRVTGWLAAALPVHPEAGGIDASTRAYAGDLLAALGDPRFDPERWHLPLDGDLGFVRIAADREFRIGTPRAQAKSMAKVPGSVIPEQEINDALTPTAEFMIAKYLVTVAQFRAFVESTRCQPDARALRDPDTRPVRHVSWHEALAYSAWLNEQLATSTLLAGHPLAARVRQQGWKVSLPSELEWEVAARGGVRGMIFPWGNEPDPSRANQHGCGIGDTSVVGCFPGNRFGLYDMVGNVWEWTRSHFARYPYDAGDGREDLAAGGSRVLRGGSFANVARNARCAYRHWLPPVNRDAIIGFRVVLRGPPVV